MRDHLFQLSPMGVWIKERNLALQSSQHSSGVEGWLKVWFLPSLELVVPHNS